MKTIVARLTRKGCTFESDRFITIEAARHWGTGRWGNYTVFLHEDSVIGSDEPCKNWVRYYKNGVLRNEY